MCGICGAYNLQPDIRISSNFIKKMCDVMAHRGPDDEGQITGERVGMGMRRLSIIGVQDGQQPISNEDGKLWIVFNGEIYNYLELREFLEKKGHKFKTHSDTECIIHLYEEFGYDCVKQLRGMFSFSIWDKNDNSLFIVRDRLGIKPLYFYNDNQILIFASEIKSILQYPGLNREIDYAGLDAFFTYTFIPAPKTIFKNIYKLEPGHYIVCKGGSITIKKYWDLCFRPCDYNQKEIIERFLDIFNQTVKIHLMSEVPLGAFLSGGIDSSLIVAFMSKNMDRPVNTFTMAFDGETGSYFDERVYARMLAKQYSTKYHEFNVKPKLDEIIDSIVSAFDEPFADDSVIPSFHICRLTKAKATVALTGLGGDELFGGYDRYLGLKLNNYYNKIPAFLRTKFIGSLIENIPESKDGKEKISQLKRFVKAANESPSLSYQSYLANIDNDKRVQFYNKEVQQLLNPGEADAMGVRHFIQNNADNFLDKAFYQDIKMYLPDDILALSDRLGMHHSLELRVPFVDHKLVEFCATIPSKFKIKYHKKKHILKKIASSYISPEIINHPKQGFASPMTSWLYSDLKEFVMDNLSEENLKKHNLLNSAYINKIVSNHMNKTEYNYKLIFSLLIFQRWYSNYIK